MRRHIQLAGLFILAIALSIAGSVFICNRYYYRPIVVLDLKELVSYQQAKMKDMDKEAAIKEVGVYFDTISKDLKGRREVVLVKEAVVNNEQFRDITSEYKK